MHLRNGEQSGEQVLRDGEVDLGGVGARRKLNGAGAVGSCGRRLHIPSAVLAGVAGAARDWDSIGHVGLLDAVVFEEEKGKGAVETSDHCRIIGNRSGAAEAVFRALHASVCLIDGRHSEAGRTSCAF